MIKDKLLFSSDSSYLYQKCKSCSRNSHVLFKCPMINPLILRTHLIEKITACKPQMRNDFSRRAGPKFNSRKNISSTQKNMILYFINSEKDEKNEKSEKSEGETFNKLSSASFDESEPSVLFKSEKLDKLSEISEKENEDFGVSSFIHIKPLKKNIKKTNLEIENSEINFDHKNNAENFAIRESSEIISSCEEKIISQIKTKKKDDFIEFDFIKLYKNYFPNFNYNIIIMLLNNEFPYRKTKFEKKTYKMRIKTKNLLCKNNKKKK